MTARRLLAASLGHPSWDSKSQLSKFSGMARKQVRRILLLDQDRRVALRVGIGESPHQDIFDYAEESGGGTDAESQRQDRNESRAKGRSYGLQRLADVRKQCFDRTPGDKHWNNKPFDGAGQNKSLDIRAWMGAEPTGLAYR